MDYQERIRLIITNLNGFLRQYQRPPHLDSEGSLTEIKAIAEEINNLISASSNRESLVERIEACFRTIRRGYTQRTWPTPGHFVKAMAEVQKSAPAITGSTEKVGDSPEEIVAKRMNAGEPVGDGWLFGINSLRLVEEGHVDQETMRKYRSALYFQSKSVGGQDYAQAIEAKMLDRHADAEAMAAMRKEGGVDPR